VDPPRLNVYVGGGGGVDWAKVKVPAGLSVHDERAAAAPGQPGGGAVVRAEIYDMATGKPVRDAQVAVVRTWNAGAYIAYVDVAKAVSDTTGQARFTNIPAGTYGLRAAADGYATRVLSYERCGRRSSKRLTVELAKSAVVSGRITDTDGGPLQEVKVYPSTVMAMDGRGYTSPGQLTIKTDAGGRFELSGLPVGYVQVGARKEGYHFSDLFTIHDVPATNIVLRLSRAGGLQVTVTDKAGQRLSRFEGNPLTVEVEPEEGNQVGSWGGSATVRDDGTVEFKNMPPGRYRIKSRPNPFHSNRVYPPEQIVTVTPGGPIQVKVVYE
jgi:protocatechuate 3,4-dioxygenase beta subunit